MTTLRPLVLLIDEDTALLSELAGHLEAAGFQALRASEISYGRLLFQERRPSMVLLDVAAGAGTGWELLGEMVAATPVLVLSANSREEDVVRAFGAGASDFVAKPPRTGELLSRIRARLSMPLTVPAAPPAVPAALRPAELQRVIRPPEAESNPLPLPPAPAAAPGEQVFIEHAEEKSLVSVPVTPPLPVAEPAPEEAPLGQRLREARQRRRISLVQAEIDTKVRMWYLQAMEEEKFSLLPRGPLTAQLLRTYAGYLGVDVSQALEDYRRRHYNEPVKPLPALGGPPLPRSIPTRVLLLAAGLLALLLGGGAILIFDPQVVQQASEALRNLINR